MAVLHANDMPIGRGSTLTKCGFLSACSVLAGTGIQARGRCGRTLTRWGAASIDAVAHGCGDLRPMSAVEDSAKVGGLAGVLDVVVGDAHQADAERDWWIPSFVNHSIEVGCSQLGQ